jgi:negative regulator of flagellin synthesis FlgM
MKIDPTAKITPATAIADERTRAGGKQAEHSETKPRADVQLSPLSGKLKDIEAGLASEQVVNAERVAEVKRAIAEGRFEVNAEKVADRLVEATKDFLRATKQ